jgi:hypothetical protein
MKFTPGQVRRVGGWAGRFLKLFCGWVKAITKKLYSLRN